MAAPSRFVTDRSSPRLAYVVPHYSDGSAEHFAHLPRLLHELDRRCDLTVVVERGDTGASLDGLKVVHIRGDRVSRLRRLFRTVRTTIGVSRKARTTWFVRYSRGFTLVLLALRSLASIRVSYWKSGQADRSDSGAAGRPPLRKRLDDRLTRLILRRVDTVVTGPEAMVRFMTERWGVPPERIALLYNDVDTQRFKPLPEDERTDVRAELGWRDDEFVVLFVHRLSPRRGTRVLVDIVGRAAEQSRTDGIRLVVVGSGPDEPRLRAEAMQSPLNIDVLGAIPNARLVEYYQSADCFLMPSYEEGFPRVLLEAMATALPVVMTDAGGSRDVVGLDYPYWGRTGDVADLSDHVAHLAGMAPSERQEIGMVLRRRVEERFTPELVAEMLLRNVAVR